MRSLRTSPARLAWLLLLAYLPALGFVGHWEPRVDIPGTDLYVGVPVSAAEEGGHPHDGHDRHCHADAGSCSDVPVTSTATVSALAEAVDLAFAGGPLLPLAAGEWSPANTSSFAPDAPPPRASLDA